MSIILTYQWYDYAMRVWTVELYQMINNQFLETNFWQPFIHTPCYVTNLQFVTYCFRPGIFSGFFILPWSVTRGIFEELWITNRSQQSILLWIWCSSYIELHLLFLHKYCQRSNGGANDHIWNFSLKSSWKFEQLWITNRWQ